MARRGGALAPRRTTRRKSGVSHKHRRGANVVLPKGTRSKYVTQKQYEKQQMEHQLSSLMKSIKSLHVGPKQKASRMSVNATRKQPSRSRKGLTPEQKEAMEAIEAVARAEEAARFIAERAATRESRKAARAAVNDLEALLGSMGVKESHSQSHNMNM